MQIPYILYFYYFLRKYRICTCVTTQWEYRDKVQQVIERTKAFLSDKQLIKYGINSGKCGTIPDMHPSAIAPKANIPDSFISHSLQGDKTKV